MKIVRAINDLGRSFGMTTVAEGVETIEQLRCLEDEGCAQVQGYLISPPRPASEIPAIIRKFDADAVAAAEQASAPAKAEDSSVAA